MSGPGSTLGADTTSAGHARLRVVLLAYYFPPMGGAGTQRMAAFARHLPDFGIDPVVVCGAEQQPGPHAIATDPTLLGGLNPAMPIVRLPAMESQIPVWHDRLSRHRATASSCEVAWSRRAADAAVFAARRHSADAIVVTASPFTLGAMVRELRDRTDLPVVLDLRDPWALDGWRSFRTPVQLWLDRHTMRRSLRDASAVIANCPRAADAYRSLAGLEPGRITTIPNGFEPRDFAGTGPRPPRDPAAPLRVIHTGTLHDPDPATGDRNRRRPFAGARLVRHRRSGRTLLEGAGRLVRRDPAAAERLRLEFVGQVHDGHRNLVDELGLGGVVSFEPYLDHDAVTARLVESDAIHVPLHDTMGGEPALIVPGKLYEALGSGRPVLGTLPPGDARHLVRRTGGDSRALAADDAAGVADVLSGWIEAIGSGCRLEGADSLAMGPFTRASLTARLAATVRATIAGKAVPADDPWDELDGLVSAQALERRHRPRSRPTPGRRAA